MNRSIALLALAAAAACAAPASAASTDGAGEGIRHVANLPIPERHNPNQHNQGTDLELARIPVDGVKRTFAFEGSYYDGLNVIDVTDPEHPQHVGAWDCGVGQGDVQVFRRADLGGRWFLTYTQDTGYPYYPDSQCVKDLEALGFHVKDADGFGTYIAEITDPYHPRAVSFLPVAQGSHNQTVHPSGRYLYNSNSDLMTSPLPAIEIADITDVAHPRMVGELALQTFPGLGTESHDITFSHDGNRAYVAALSHGEILDTTDPAKPVSIATIVDPSLNVWHEMESVHVKDPQYGEGDFLIAEDEFAGAEGTAQCPNGGVHVYDVTGDKETHPVPVGAFNIDQAGVAPGNDPGSAYVARCTAHVFQIDHRSKLMTMGWYNAGVRVVDLSSLVGVALGNTGVAGMRQVGWYRFPDSDTWAAKAVRASRKGYYIFGNDKRRGFDVYRFTGPSTVSSPGIWMTPEQALQANQRLRAAGPPSFAGVCFIGPRARAHLVQAAIAGGSAGVTRLRPPALDA
jgi:hypothetical protein